jgi:hypothetical protein
MRKVTAMPYRRDVLYVLSDRPVDSQFVSIFDSPVGVAADHALIRGAEPAPGFPVGG